MSYLSKSILNISQLFNALLIFVIIIDPTDTIFHMKKYIYAIFLILNFQYIRTSKTAVFSLIASFVVLFLSIAIEILSSEPFYFDLVLNSINPFLFLTYLLWVRTENLNTFRYLYATCFIISLFIVFCYIIYFFNEYLYQAIFIYSSAYNNTIIMSNREFMGISFRMIYYKSCPIVVIPYAYSWYKYLINKKTRKRYLFFSIIFGSCLIISGTRANMLSGIMLPLIILLYYFLKIKKNILGFYLILMSSAIFFMYIIAKILTDLNESSFVIKSGHLYSYIKLFSENPIQMIIGYGPGSMFYSSGNGLMVSETELTYFEILRRYGLIGAFLILWIFFCPIIFMYQKIKNNKEYFPFFMGYITYLFIGGTNPLLFSSTGIIVLIQNYMFCDENNMKMAQNVLN